MITIIKLSLNDFINGCLIDELGAAIYIHENTLCA
jgi:hypothetical protein